MFKKDKKKLEENLAFLTNESKKYWNIVEGLEHWVGEAERAKKEVEDELYHEKKMYDLACFEATLKLKNAEAELAAMWGDLEQTWWQARMAEMEVEQLKVDVKVRVAKEHEEVESDIFNAFVFTLWKTHPDLNFSCFGEEAMEVVKKYVVDATDSRVVTASLEPDQTMVVLSAEDVSNPTPQDAATPSSTSLGH